MMVTEELRDRYDVAVVGAGPAGLAATALCVRAGLKCVLFDDQPSPGGQIYRNITCSPLSRHAVLGEDYWRGETIVRDALASDAHYVAAATVWGLLSSNEIAVSIEGITRQISAARIIITTGAIERPFPIPGWTLPGVMTAGAAQILLKSSALVPDGPTILAGCGPFLWLLAWQYLNVGVRLDAILDTAAQPNWHRLFRHAIAFAASPYMIKGLELMHKVRRAVRVVTRVVELTAGGDERVESVSYATARGCLERLPCNTLLLHQGVVPNVNLAMSANVEHYWSDTQRCWVPLVDDFGSTNVPHIAIAGDGAGIAGADAAVARGQIAAIAAIRALTSKASHQNEERNARRMLRRFERGRTFLDLLYQPAPQFRLPRDETIVCRCEEITARQVIEATAFGCPGPNQIKAFLRCGMGPCQGRFCGLTVTELMAETRGVSCADVGYFHLRPPVKPITLAEIAGLRSDEVAMKAVVRE
jgi:thioredoxin reductase